MHFAFIYFIYVQSDSGVNHSAGCTWISFQSGEVGLLGKAAEGLSKHVPHGWPERQTEGLYQTLHIASSVTKTLRL